MQETRTIKPISRRDPQIIATLAGAFQDDPALSWLLPDPRMRARRLPAFFSVVEEQSRRAGKVLASTNGEAASLWYPPGDIAHGWWPQLTGNLRMAAVFRTALVRGIALEEAMHEHHPHPQPDWYLRYVGVAPEAQGKGWGSAIVREGIALAAARGCGVLLETAKPENVSLYSRLGFAITSEWSAPEDGPKFWTMRRPSDV